MSLYDQLFAEPKPKKYRFTAICDSDQCRSMTRSGLNGTGKRTEAGIIKRVPKGTMQCPKCEMFLFWNKEEVI